MSRGTTHKCFRLADDVWARFQERAQAEGTTRTELLREWVTTYVETGAPVHLGPDTPNAPAE